MLLGNFITKMHGTFRFLLAVLVLLSHLDLFFGFNQGWAAVFAFYILAGAVSSKLYSQIYFNNGVKYFLGRLYRIMPSALFTLFFGMVLLKILSPQDFHFSSDLLSAMLVPLPYDAFLAPFDTISKNIHGNESSFAFAPYFSLGIELQAYLLLALLLKHKQMLKLLAYYSFFLFVFFSFYGGGSGIAENAFLVYSFIFSVFFLFYLGYLLFNKQYIDYFMFWLLSAFALFLSKYFWIYNYGGSRDLWIGLVIFMPIIFIVQTFKVKIKYDKILGIFSYLIYLTHYIAIYVYKIYFDKTIIFSWELFAFVFSLTMIFSVIVYFCIERFIIRAQSKKCFNCYIKSLLNKHLSTHYKSFCLN